MSIGFLTVSMWISLKVTADTEPEPPCHVLIRTPLSECRMTVLLTVMFLTHARELWLPKLPMLDKNIE